MFRLPGVQLAKYRLLIIDAPGSRANITEDTAAELLLEVFCQGYEWRLENLMTARLAESMTLTERWALRNA